MLVRFFVEDEGATAIEYGLISSLIAMAIIVALNAVADANAENYRRINEAVAGATGGNAGP